MPICHNSACTSVFFKNINLKLKWTTSHFHSAPKTLERQLLNQNIALQFFLPFSSSGHLLMLTLLVFVCTILSFNPPHHLSSTSHASMILQKVRTHNINLTCLSLKDASIDVERADCLWRKGAGAYILNYRLIYDKK